MQDMEYKKLQNGNTIPCIGLGTDDVLFVRKLSHSNNKYIQRFLSIYQQRILRPYLNYRLSLSITNAIRSGFRLIDTSAAYNNEKAIGRAIRNSGVSREELFVTTRITNKQQYEGNVRDSFFKSLSNFGLEYIDLYMIHWPVPEHYLHTWKEMEKLCEEGYIKNLGVANCHQHHIEELLKICKIRPVINQFEVHPLFSQKPLIEYCKKNGIQVEAYSPIAQNNDRLRKNRVLNGLAKKYGKTMQQIILRWHIDNGVIPIPRSTNAQRLKQNVDIFDFELTQEEIESIDAININSRLRYDPDNCDFTLL